MPEMSISEINPETAKYFNRLDFISFVLVTKYSPNTIEAKIASGILKSSNIRSSLKLRMFVLMTSESQEFGLNVNSETYCICIIDNIRETKISSKTEARKATNTFERNRKFVKRVYYCNCQNTGYSKLNWIQETRNIDKAD